MLIRAKACGHEELAIADEESLADGHKGMMVCILHEKKMVDVQTIYHAMEPRNLRARKRRTYDLIPLLYLNYIEIKSSYPINISIFAYTNNIKYYVLSFVIWN